MSLWQQRLACRCNSLRHAMCSLGEVVPGSWDPGSGRLQRLPGGEVWRVTCACTQASCWLQQQLSVSCPSLLFTLIAAALTHLWCCLGGALNPLSLCTPKQWSLGSSAGPDFFSDSLPASCGALAPFRLCSHSQPQSSPWDLTSEA